MISPLYRIAVVLLLTISFGAVAAPSLDSTKDWSEVAAIAREGGLPVAILVTGTDCGHCERMRREFLADPKVPAVLEEQTVIREFHQNTGGKVTDFDGERIRSRVFLSRYQVFATPTLLFFIR